MKKKRSVPVGSWIEVKDLDGFGVARRVDRIRGGRVFTDTVESVSLDFPVAWLDDGSASVVSRPGDKDYEVVSLQVEVARLRKELARAREEIRATNESCKYLRDKVGRVSVAAASIVAECKGVSL